MYGRIHINSNNTECSSIHATTRVLDCYVKASMHGTLTVHTSDSTLTLNRKYAASVIEMPNHQFATHAIITVCAPTTARGLALSVELATMNTTAHTSTRTQRVVATDWTTVADS